MRVDIGFPVVRTDGHVITKFSGMGRLPHFLTYGAPPTLARFARGWSSAIIGFKSELEHAVKTPVKKAKYAEFTEVMTNVDTRSREAIKGK